MQSYIFYVQARLLGSTFVSMLVTHVFVPCRFDGRTVVSSPSSIQTRLVVTLLHSPGYTRLMRCSPTPQRSEPTKNLPTQEFTFPLACLHILATAIKGSDQKHVSTVAKYNTCLQHGLNLHLTRTPGDIQAKYCRGNHVNVLVVVLLCSSA